MLFIFEGNNLFLSEENETDNFQMGLKCVIKAKGGGKSVQLRSSVVCRPVDEKETLKLRSNKVKDALGGQSESRSLTCPPDEVVKQSYCYFSNTEDFNVHGLFHEFQTLNVKREMPVKFTCAIRLDK